MSWNVRYRESAADDLARAAEWLDEQHGTSAGHRLVRAVLDLVGRIAARPHAYPVWREAPTYRRALVPAYPYLVFFTIDESSRTLTVEAVAHTSRAPGYWRTRR